MSWNPPPAGKGRPLVGTVVSSPDPALAESLVRAFDFVWIDLEHGALSLRDAQTLVMAVQGANRTAFVRVPTWDSEHLTAVLDIGVDGVVAPMLATAEEAIAFVRRLRYPPKGSRGFGPRRAGGYGRTPNLWASPEAKVACVVQIETPGAVDHASAIAAVDGVDALVVGTADLSFGLGSPQELRSSAMRAAINHTGAAAEDAGVAFGVAVGGDPLGVREVVSARSSFVVYSVDLRIYAAAADAAAREIKESLEGMREEGSRHVRA